MAQHGVKGPKTTRAHLIGIRKKCEKLGVWRDEFAAAARRLARIYAHIDQIEPLTESESFEYLTSHTNKNGSTNMIKNPLLGQLDDFYEQALTLERELGLTSAALKRIKNESGEQSPADPFEKLLTTE